MGLKVTKIKKRSVKGKLENKESLKLFIIID